jgi:hypothetical protein
MSQNRIEWPCGCVTERTDEQTFTIKPHSLVCEVYRIAIRESQAQGNLIITAPSPSGPEEGD